MKAVASSTVAWFALLIYIQAASAQTWTQTLAPAHGWYGLACSADGSKLVGVAPYFDYACTSPDSGNSWVSNAIPTVQWWNVASSADGTKLVAISYSSGSGIFTSTNSGSTWVSNNVPPAGWFAVASSADGTGLIAVAGGGQLRGPIYTSTNSGGNWVSNNVPPDFWFSVASSADGTKLIAVEQTGYYTSTNSGNLWTSNGIPSAEWTAVASSADGSKLLAAVLISGNHYLLTSTNFGASWITNTAPVSRTLSVASSADGSTLMASETERIWLSTNSGATWVSNNINGFWRGIAMSADGKKIFAADQASGGIWILSTPPSPQLNLSATAANLNFSWTVPSTNLVLQESPDLNVWITLTNTPTPDDACLQEELSLSPTNNNGYFRLISQ